jgi:hypothetical protein
MSSSFTDFISPQIPAHLHDDLYCLMLRNCESSFFIIKAICFRMNIIQTCSDIYGDKPNIAFYF